MSNLSAAQFSALTGYTSLGNKTSWKNIAQSLSEGTTPNEEHSKVQAVSNLISAVNQHSSSERPTHSKLLVSGVNLPKGNKIPKKGEYVHHPLSSATSKDSVAEGFALQGKGKPVVFHYPHDVRALDVAKMGVDHFGDESEHIVSGSFEVRDIYKEKNITHVNLRAKTNN
jgi:hypothetical protein